MITPRAKGRKRLRVSFTEASYFTEKKTNSNAAEGHESRHAVIEAPKKIKKRRGKMTAASKLSTLFIASIYGVFGDGFSLGHGHSDD